MSSKGGILNQENQYQQDAKERKALVLDQHATDENTVPLSRLAHEELRMDVIAKNRREMQQNVQQQVPQQQKYEITPTEYKSETLQYQRSEETDAISQVTK